METGATGHLGASQVTASSSPFQSNLLPQNEDTGIGGGQGSVPPPSLPLLVLGTSRGQARKMALQKESEEKNLPVSSLFLQLS